MTRPLTMLAFALPAGACAIVAMHRHRRWRDLLPAVAATAAILSFQALWNRAVVGDWRKMPHAEYARLYTPSDRLGFHANAAPPAAAGTLSPDEQLADRTMRRVQDGYTVASVPGVAATRAANIIHGTWSYGGLPGLAILAAVAVLPLAVSRALLGTILCVFAAYLLWPMDSTWTLYYLELQAPLAFLTAVGVCAMSRWTGTRVTEQRRWPGLGPARARTVLSIALGVWLIWPIAGRIGSYRRAHAEHRVYREHFQRVIAALPHAPSVVFVHYASRHGEERLVDNVPDLQSAQTWIVHDLGPENSRLLALAASRVPYLYWESLSGSSIQGHIRLLSP